MKVGVVGLGRMGNAIARRLLQAEHSVVGFDLSENNLVAFERRGGRRASSVTALAQEVAVVWLMVPAGEPVDNVLAEVLAVATPGQIVVDGGNSWFQNSVKRAARCEKKGVSFLDCGTSGGVHGEKYGFCLMVGGKQKPFEQLMPVWQAVAAPDGFGLVGPAGAGHYVKMVHNGIEYALLQAYAEGFALLKDGRYKNINLEQVAAIWLHGSVIRSWILELAKNIFEKDQEFAQVKGVIGGGQTGRWTVEEGQQQDIPLPLIELSLALRDATQQQEGGYASKLVALLRNQFGGHRVEYRDE